jgi:hypothetical protein
MDGIFQLIGLQVSRRVQLIVGYVYRPVRRIPHLRMSCGTAREQKREKQQSQLATDNFFSDSPSPEGISGLAHFAGDSTLTWAC